MRSLVRMAVVLLAIIVAPMPLIPSMAHASGSGRILIVGDSITQGSSGDYTWRYRLWNSLRVSDPGYAFVGTRTDLYDNVNSQFGSQYYATNFTGDAHGAQWGGSLVNQGPLVKSQMTSTSATVLVELYGSNDLSYLTSPAQTIDNVRTFVTNARQVNPTVRIVLGEALTKWDAWNQVTLLTSESSDYNQRLATLASQLNTSTSRVVVAHTANGWNAQKFTWDGTHPNSTGETFIAQRVAEALGSIGIGSTNPSIYGTTAWNVAASAVTVTPGVEQAALSWNPVPSGATGMFVENRITDNNSAWTRLPYAVSGTGWTETGLVPGATYQFRVVPSKGTMTGLAGPVTSAYISSKPVGTISTLTVAPTSESTAAATWTSSSNATGYYLMTRKMGNDNEGWSQLPYPVTQLSWTFSLLSSGYRYYFGVQPIRGLYDGSLKSSAETRQPGIAGDRTYVALGDSYSSGLGTDQADNTSCHRSSTAWASEMQADWNHYTSVIACAGAVISDVSSSQIPAMKNYFSSHPTDGPQLITLTVGGNDVGFSAGLQDCAVHACLGDEAAMDAKIDAQRSRLATLYRSIRQASPDADIMVGGYPGVLEVGGNDPALVCDAIGDDERAMINRLAARLNSVVAGAASDAGVWSVGQRVYDEFDPGHNGCALIGAWINRPVLDISGFSLSDIEADPQSFHPNAAGQLAYSVAFSDALIAAAG